MNLLQPHDVTCPHCWEQITLTVDVSAGSQSYIEDCPVCCKAMAVSFTAHDGEVDELSAEAAD